MKKVTKRKRKIGFMEKLSYWGIFAISLAVIFISAAVGTSARMLVATLFAAIGVYLGFLWLQKTTIMTLLIVCLYQAGIAFAGGVGSKVVGIVLIFPLVLALFLDIEGTADGIDLKESLKDKAFWKLATLLGLLVMFLVSVVVF